MTENLTNPAGNILNFFCEMPHHLSNPQIEVAYDELNAELIGMREPSVALLDPAFGEWSNVEDYRLFYVHFEAEATREDFHQAVDIVMNALVRLRGEQPPT